MAQRKKTSKPKQSRGVAKGREVVPVKEEKSVPKQPEESRSIPIGMPVPREKFEELKKKSRKKD